MMSRFIGCASLCVSIRFTPNCPDKEPRCCPSNSEADDERQRSNDDSEKSRCQPCCFLGKLSTPPQAGSRRSTRCAGRGNTCHHYATLQPSGPERDIGKFPME